jgi:hypothetical protein
MGRGIENREEQRLAEGGFECGLTRIWKHGVALEVSKNRLIEADN